MNILVYDGWLETLGGGERQALAAAEALQALGQVTVVSHRAVEPDVLGARLGVDVGGLGWVCRPEASSAARTFAGLACDLFVNATHHSRFMHRTVPSIGFVYFPPRRPVFRLRASKVAKWSTGKGLGGAWTGDGWFGPEGVGRRWYQQSDGAGWLVVRPGARLRLWLADLAEEDDGSRSSYRIKTSGGEVLLRGEARSGGGFAPSEWFEVPGGVSSLVLESAGRVVTRRGERRVLGLALGAVEEGGGPVRSALRRASRRLFGLPRRWVVESGLTDYSRIYRSYDEVTANSRYTAHWLERWWGVEAEVVEPPVIAGTQERENDSPLILSVGRFFSGGHNKKHDVMVDAFRRLVECGLTGWRLALVGGLGQERADHAYLRAVRRAAADLPIDLYVDADEALVADLRGRAALCWHAAGYGEPPTRHPERYEHFGMAVAELMGAGVVPIVLDGGGLREIVEHGRTGLRWRTLDELAQYTLRLARDARLRRRLAGAGRQRAARWSLETYQRRVVDLAERAYARRADPRGPSSSRLAPA